MISPPPKKNHWGFSKEEEKAKIGFDTYLENEGFPAESIWSCQPQKWPRDTRKSLRSHSVPGDFPDIYSVKLIEISAGFNVGEAGATEIAFF